jgi:hypothetical protein
MHSGSIGREVAIVAGAGSGLGWVIPLGDDTARAGGRDAHPMRPCGRLMEPRAGAAGLLPDECR